MLGIPLTAPRKKTRRGSMSSRIQEVKRIQHMLRLEEEFYRREKRGRN